MCAPTARNRSRDVDAGAREGHCERDRLPPTRSRRPRASRTGPRVDLAEVAFLMNDIMNEVITRGTRTARPHAGRTDLRGKTRTANSSVDTSFNGFNDSLVASVWVSTDHIRPLGESEEGARTAVPSGWTSCAKRCAACPKKDRAARRNRRDEGQRRDWRAKGRRPRSDIRIFPRRSVADRRRLCRRP